jgi:hypothetical protein
LSVCNIRKNGISPEMVKLNSKKEKKCPSYEEKDLIGLTPGIPWNIKEV